MKIGIIYYSFSGNTKKACEFLKAKMSGLGYGVETVEVRLKEEERSFLGQGKAASQRSTPEITNPDLSLERFDLAVFASPVWAFTFTPALRSFLAACTLPPGKKCACFLTCGSSLLSGNALKEFSGAIAEKGGTVVFAEYISGKKTSDSVYLEQRFAPLFKNI
jgi:flavodoxin